MEDWEENTSSNSGVLRSTRFDDQYSRSGGDLVKKREGAAASSSRTARQGLGLRVDSVTPAARRAILHLAQKRQGHWRFTCATSAKTAGSD